MGNWIPLIVLVAVVLFLLLFRVRVALVYNIKGFSAVLRLGPGRVMLYPRPKKEKKPKEQKKQPAKAKKAEEERRPGALEKLRSMLPAIVDTLKRFKRYVRIDLLEVDFTAAAAKDPAKAAILYGSAWATAGGVLPLLEENFDVRKRRFTNQLRFDLDQPVIYVKATLSLAFWQAIVLVAGFVGALIRKRTQERKESQPAPQAAAIERKKPSRGAPAKKPAKPAENKKAV